MAQKLSGLESWGHAAMLLRREELTLSSLGHFGGKSTAWLLFGDNPLVLKWGRDFSVEVLTSPKIDALGNGGDCRSPSR